MFMFDQKNFTVPILILLNRFTPVKIYIRVTIIAVSKWFSP